MRPSSVVLPLGLLLAGSLANVNAAEVPSWNAAFRYRLEHVDQDGPLDAATAHTARLRLGKRWQLSPAISAVLEGEGVVALNDHFNSGANGRTQYSSVIDPTSIEVNQAMLQWTHAHGDARLGRQRIAFDNQRFIGNVGWRQNEQTFDAALLTWKPTATLDMQFAWLERVHRVASDRARDPLARERELSAPLARVAWRHGPGQLVGYAYQLDDRDVATASSLSTGLRWTAAKENPTWRWNAALEFARQRDAADNPLDFTHNYHLLEAGAGRGSWGLKAGLEHLGGNGTHAFQTPLATLHAFNGWADVFTTTPASGLDDRYLGFSQRWTPKNHAPFDAALVWHDYQSDAGSVSYGQEWNASLSTALGHGWTAMAKYADYQSDGFARDTRKIWLQVEWTR